MKAAKRELEKAEREWGRLRNTWLAPFNDHFTDSGTFEWKD